MCNYLTDFYLYLALSACMLTSRYLAPYSPEKENLKKLQDFFISTPMSLSHSNSASSLSSLSTYSYSPTLPSASTFLNSPSLPFNHNISPANSPYIQENIFSEIYSLLEESVDFIESYEEHIEYYIAYVNACEFTEDDNIKYYGEELAQTIEKEIMQGYKKLIRIEDIEKVSIKNTSHPSPDEISKYFTKFEELKYLIGRGILNINHIDTILESIQTEINFNEAKCIKDMSEEPPNELYRSVLEAIFGFALTMTGFTSSMPMEISLFFSSILLITGILLFAIRVQFSIKIYMAGQNKETKETVTESFLSMRTPVYLFKNHQAGGNLIKSLQSCQKKYQNRFQKLYQKQKEHQELLDALNQNNTPIGRSRPRYSNACLPIEVDSKKRATSLPPQRPIVLGTLKRTNSYSNCNTIFESSHSDCYA